MNGVSWKKYIQNVSLVFVGLLVSFLVVEGVLRLYNPFGVRVRGDQIVLPKNQYYRFPNDSIESLPETIIHTKNSLGFRGPEPPENFEERLTVMAVGGSTTECFYLPDGMDWPARLAVQLSQLYPGLWMNNAGLDGHSTFGHLHLLKQYLVKLKPDAIIFLIGHNDIGLDAPKKFDRKINNSLRFTLDKPKEMIRGLINRSEVLSLLFTMYRYYAYRAEGLGHDDIDLPELKKIPPDPERTGKILKKHQRLFLSEYRNRVRKLVTISKNHGIVPILLTQPVLYGDTTDPKTGVDLGHVPVGKMSGRGRWKLMELYNEVTREVARERDVGLVDLARVLPKNSRYYYDYIHYTPAGTQKIARLLDRPVCRILARRLPSVNHGQCRLRGEK